MRFTLQNALKPFLSSSSGFMLAPNIPFLSKKFSYASRFCHLSVVILGYISTLSPSRVFFSPEGDCPNKGKINE
jgi:hypothetical protein